MSNALDGKYLELTLEELEELEPIAQGQADDLLIEDGDTRVWLSRCGVEDGEPFDNAVTIERRIMRGDPPRSYWEEIEKYPAG
jgi:hypothetical protein